MANVVRIKRHEAPILFPGLIKNRKDAGGFILVIPHIEMADHQTVDVLHPFFYIAQHFRWRAEMTETVGIEIAHLGIAAGFDKPSKIGGVVRHHDGRGRVEAFDEKPAFVIDRQAERAGEPRDAPGGRPALRRSEES